MDDNKNIFLKHKILISAFLLVFVCFIFFYYKFSLGLFFDIPAVFASVIFPFDGNHFKFLMFHHDRVRIFNDFLVAIPFNCIFCFVKNSGIINALKAFSTSYFIIHLFALFLNYFIARRTKRYDIAVICFLFYVLFSIPNAIWAIREIHIAILFYFALLSYFLSEENLNIKDAIPVTLLIIYMFESFETTVVYGLILFLSALLYTKRNKENKNAWFKALIGFCLLAVVFYMPLKMIYLKYAASVNIQQGAAGWIIGSVIALKHLFSGNILISIFGIIIAALLVFYKKALGLKSLFFFCPVIMLIFYLLYLKTGFIPEPHIELQYYSLVLWFIFPVIITIILFDYFEIHLSNYNQHLFSNIVIIACVFGILNLLWQVHSCFEFGKYEKYIKNLIHNSEETIIKIPEEDFSKYSFLKYNTCFGTVHKAVFMMNPDDKAKIILPSDYYCDYNEFCFDDVNNTFYDENNNILYLQTAPFRVKTRYWNLTPIVDEFRKQGRIKN